MTQQQALETTEELFYQVVSLILRNASELILISFQVECAKGYDCDGYCLQTAFAYCR
jgi:hypothetical protein